MINSHSLRYLPVPFSPSQPFPTSTATILPSRTEPIYTHILTLTHESTADKPITMILTDLASMIFRLAEVRLHLGTTQAAP